MIQTKNICDKFMECSAKTGENVEKVFIIACQLTSNKRKQKHDQKVLLENPISLQTQIPSKSKSGCEICQ